METDVSNGDAQLHAEFFIYQGEGQFKGVPHIRIWTPGDKTHIPEYVATEHYKRRFAREWLAFQMQNGDGAIIGTPLVEWQKDRPDELNDNQRIELDILKFKSVEQVAGASDAQVMRIGMGGMGLRELAKRYLTQKNAQIAGAEMTKLKDELDMMKAAMARMQAAHDTPQAPKEEVYRAGTARKPRKGKPGRPRKKDIAHGELDTASVGATDR